MHQVNNLQLFLSEYVPPSAALTDTETQLLAFIFSEAEDFGLYFCIISC